VRIKFKNDVVYMMDVMELEIEKPSSLECQWATFSVYKQRNAMKFLSMISGCGAHIFSSDGFGGKLDDEDVTRESGVVDLIAPGSVVTADKGMLVYFLLGNRGVTLWAPPKKKNNVPFAAEDNISTWEVANLRVHVERLFARTKVFRCWDKPIPLSQVDLATPLWCVCSMLTNMYPPLQSEGLEHAKKWKGRQD